MFVTPRSSLLRYGSAMLAVILAWLFRWLLDDFLGDLVPYATFFLAVTFATWYSGFYPSLLAIALSCVLSAYFFVPPRMSVQVHGLGNMIGMGLFVTVSMMIMLIGQAMRMAIRRSDLLATQDRARHEQLEREIAERKHTEAALRHSEQLFQSFMSNSPITAYVKDEDGRYVYVNPLIEQIFRKPQAEWLGKTDVDLFPEPLAVQYQEHDRAVLAADHSMQFAERSSHDDGEHHWLSFKFTMRDGSGHRLIAGVSVDVTERKRMEDALRQGEERFRVALKSVPLIVGHCDRELRYTWLYSPQHGTTIEQALGKRDDEILPPETAREIVELKQAALERGMADRREIRLQLDGRVYHYDVTAEPLRSPAGEVLGLTLAALDITARKRTEMHNALLADLGEHIQANHGADAVRLRVSSLVATRLDVTRAVFCDLDLKRNLLMIHRDPASAISGDELWSTVGRISLPRLGPIIDELLQGKTVHCRDVRADARTMSSVPAFKAMDTLSLLAVPLVRDGKWAAMLMLQHAAPRDWAAEEIELVKIVAERTWLAVENQRLSAEIRRSEEQFRAMAETTPDILFVSRPDGALEYINQRFYEYTGQAPGTGLGDGWKNALHPDDRTRNQEHWEHSRMSGLPYENELRLRASNGSYRWFVRRSRPVLTQSGRVARWFGTCTDIDARKQAEAVLHEADRRKDEFLATLAHELRNPLAPIRNAVGILGARGAMDPKLEWAHGVIHRQVQQLTRLVDDLLDVSRITRGKIELRRELVDMTDIVHSALETSRPLIESCGHAITIVLSPEHLRVHADVTRMAQVLANLLNNAAKYTEEGGHIWVTAERDGAHAVLRVRDTGIGIAADMLPRIFDMFTQAHRALARAQGGLGIGLTLVQKLVELHDGTIEARSEGPGKGSEFIVRLPLHAAPARAARAPEQPGPALTMAPPARRILVVDDNADSADTLAMLLEAQGNDVRIAYDGQRALEQASAFVPDLVLLDIGLPDISGYEVAQRLRQQPALKNAVLIAQTGWGQDSDRRRSREAGFDHHMVKPIDLAALQAVLVARTDTPAASIERPGS